MPSKKQVLFAQSPSFGDESLLLFAFAFQRFADVFQRSFQLLPSPLKVAQHVSHSSRDHRRSHGGGHSCTVSHRAHRGRSCQIMRAVSHGAYGGHSGVTTGATAGFFVSTNSIRAVEQACTVSQRSCFHTEQMLVRHQQNGSMF